MEKGRRGWCSERAGDNEKGTWSRPRKQQGGSRPAVSTGKAASEREASDTSSARFRRGRDGGRRGRGKQQQHGKPCRWRARANRNPVRDRRGRVAERRVRLRRSGTAEGGKGPQGRRGEGRARRTPGVARPRTPAWSPEELEPPHAEAQGKVRGSGASRDCGRRQPGVNRLVAGFGHDREAEGGVQLPRCERRKPTRQSRWRRIDPCARGMLPLESALPESRTAGSVSGERNRGQARD